MTRPLVMKPHVLTCACGKWYSPTRDEARKLRREIAGHNGGHNPVRFYECESGGWHWTSQIERPS